LNSDQLNDLILEKIKDLDPAKRNKFISDIAKLQQVNPKDRAFTTSTDNKREFLLQKCHSVLKQFEMKRKTKSALKLHQQQQQQQSGQIISSNLNSLEKSFIQDNSTNETQNNEPLDDSDKNDNIHEQTTREHSRSRRTRYRKHG